MKITLLEESASRGLGRSYTVVFDGDCRVCTRLVNGLRRWDQNRQLEVVSSQQSGVTARFPWIPARAYVEALQLIAADGTTWQGAAAIEQLLTVLPRGRLISWVFRIPLVRTLADRFYRWFARNRYRLGCGAHCQVRPFDPSPVLAGRDPARELRQIDYHADTPT
jgi:predicted DCC family thiol-disulfide oxidoreductase YuxK